MSYNSKYTGVQVESLLDEVSEKASQWNDGLQDIDDLKGDLEDTHATFTESLESLQQDLEKAKEATAQAAQIATDATNRFSEWARDGVFNKSEKSGLIREYNFIQEDYKEIKAQIKPEWEITSEAFDAAYAAYINIITSVLEAFTSDQNPDVVPIPDNFNDCQQEYYYQRTSLLQTIYDKTNQDVQDLRDNAAAAGKLIEALTDQYNDLHSQYLTLQKDLDGVIESHFYEGAPTINSTPTSAWIDDETNIEAINHIGDTYTDISQYNADDVNSTAGQSWRWVICNEHNLQDYPDVIAATDAEGTTYYLHWHQIADSDAILALQQAAKAQSTADGKCSTYLTKPNNAYQKGDIWILDKDYSDGNNWSYQKGDILIAEVNCSGLFSYTDWSKLINYATPETVLEQIESNLKKVRAGGQNLLRNSGFTGDYLSTGLVDNTILNASSSLYNSKVIHWEGTDAKEDNVSADAASGSGNKITLKEGSFKQQLEFPLVVGDSYVFSFKAKGTYLKFSTGGAIKTIGLDPTQWVQHQEKFTLPSNGTVLDLSGSNCELCNLQLEAGEYATPWSRSPFDNSSDRTYYESLKYLDQALNQGSTKTKGGLVLTSHIKVGNYKDRDMIKETGGMQGTWSSDNSPFLWGGGTLEQAAKAVSENGEGEDEANFVVTHGGKAILNDAVVRGTVYASDGMFTGTVNATSGEFNNVDVQTGKIADFNISGSHLGIQKELGGNGMFLYNQYIGFRKSEDGYKREAIVGENILPAEAGITGLAKYENTTTDSYEAMDGTGYGVISNVSGYKHSYAFASEKGVFAGFRPHVAILGSSNDSPLQLGKYHHTILAWYGGTIVLDGTPENGQEYEIICPNTSVEEGRVQIITYDGTKKNIYLMLDGIERSGFSVHDLEGTRQVVKLVYFAQNDTWFAWHHTY